MLLTITTSHAPATDLGFLLHKNPARLHGLELPFGRARMFFPEASPARCRFALMVEVDPVALVRGKTGGDGLIDHYVNDRPYAASSFLSVALSRALGTALGGRSKERQALAETAIPLEATITPAPVKGGRDFVERLFAPLGYRVAARPLPLDPAHPDWGDSRYLEIALSGCQRLKDLLSHLYLLIPVLDDAKHYWIGRAEVEKLLAKGGDWLAGHPEKTTIARRYLKRRDSLVREALARLAEGEPEAELAPEVGDKAEQSLERPMRLSDQRIAAVTETLAAAGVRRVVDLGCGEGRLLRALLEDPRFEQVAGLDASLRSLERAERRLRLERRPARQRDRIQLLHGALTYRDRRLEAFDGAALVEVIEHLDPDRLPALAHTVFACMAPATLVVTTPNREYNRLFEGLPAGALRHSDHRFEWTRAEFAAWAEAVARQHGYGVTFVPIGAPHEALGAPTQMAVFSKAGNGGET